MLLIAAVTAEEPPKPDVNPPLDQEKELKVNEVIGLHSDEVFERLKDIEFIIDEQMSYRAVYRAFTHRKEEAISLALDSLKLPVMRSQDGKMVNRSDDITVARRIMEVFPDESVTLILALYRDSDAVTKGNVIRVLCKMAGGIAVRTLLIDALDDKTPCGEEDPEVGGAPLRLCDVAYNQLVLRYQMKQVLRAIGPVYRVEVRDYHINILKEKLNAGQSNN
jgi:hypothetical protein